jgi:hypothetical protein
MRATAIVAIAVIAATPPTASLAQKADRPNPTYDAVVKGMSCKQRQTGEMDCEYQVGQSLRFGISGVSQPDAAVMFYKVDAADEYYAGVIALHGCVVIRPARSAGADSVARFAFVSPRDGKVYRDWQSCFKTTKPPSPP